MVPLRPRTLAPLLALVVVACSPTAPAGREVSVESGQGPQASAVARDDAGDTGVLEPTGRLEGLWQLWFADDHAGSEQDPQDAWSEFHEAVRTCMERRGHAYVPPAYPSLATMQDLQAQQRALAGTRAYAERFGFGMATTIEAAEISTSYAEAFPHEDPNDVRLAEMEVDDRLAFLEALLGPPVPGVHVLGEQLSAHTYESEDPALGCYGEAGGPDPGDGLPDLAWEDLAGTEDRVLADRDIQAILPAWASCMRDHGYDFTKPADGPAHVEEAAGGMIPFVGQTVVDVQAPGGSMVPLTIGKLDEEALRRAIEIEIAVATADFDCQESTGYRALEEEVLRREQMAWLERWVDFFPADGE